MRLSRIHRHNQVLDGLIGLYATLVEDKDVSGPSWPVKWAEDALRQPNFQAWLSKLGVTGEVGKPMAGNVGRAYPIGDFIVKFTTDSKEANAAAVLQGHDSRHAADVHGVHRVSSFDHGGRRVNLFAIVMQKLNTGVGGRMRMAGNAVYQYLDNFSGFIEDPDAVIKLVMDRYVPARYKNDKNAEIAVRKMVQALYDVQEKTGVLSQDPHGGNVAFKDREPAFFDFGRSSVNFDHPKVDGARVTTLPA